MPSTSDDGDAAKSLPSVQEMRGVHAGRYEQGEVLEQLREMNEEERRLEREVRFEDE